MKKILFALYTIALSFIIMTGCTTALAPNQETENTTEVTNNSTEPQKTSSNELNIAIFYYNFSDVYVSSVRANINESLDTLGIAYQNYDGNSNQATQLEQINTAVTNGANLLIVNIVETALPDAAQTVIDLAKKAEIPIIFFNREIDDELVSSYDNCAFVGTNASEAGHLQGGMIGEYLVANYDTVDLNKDGMISYVMFKGQEGNIEAETRTQYAVEDANAILTAAGKPALMFYDANNTSKYLVDQGGNWSPQAATDYMNIILADYSEANGNMVELVIANNDGMAEGAIASLQSAGYNTGANRLIPVFGVDATDSARELISKNQMIGTIMQDSKAMADTVTTLVENIRLGEELMANTDSLNIDETVNKIRVPYSVFSGIY